MNTPLHRLRVRIFADGADRPGMLALAQDPLIRGLTTNPTLMHAVGIRDYEAFARDVLNEIRTKPLSLEVFSDEFPEMHRQARKIASWGDNVFVKIPVTNTRGESSADLVRELCADGIKVNVTAVLTPAQVEVVRAALGASVPAIVSVFAGRIADTGRDPVPVIARSLEILRELPRAEVLWASVREPLNIYQADACGCGIVTVTHDVLRKAIQLSGKDLTELSRETVSMFARDAERAGFTI